MTVRSRRSEPVSAGRRRCTPLRYTTTPAPRTPAVRLQRVYLHIRQSFRLKHTPARAGEISFALISTHRVRLTAWRGRGGLQGQPGGPRPEARRHAQRRVEFLPGQRPHWSANPRAIITSRLMAFPMQGSFRRASCHFRACAAASTCHLAAPMPVWLSLSPLQYHHSS